MKRFLKLFFVFVVCGAIQVKAVKNISFFPHLIFLVVMYEGVFLGIKEGILAGVMGGFINGCFSGGTFFLGLASFPIAAVAAFLLAKMLNRQNPAVQMFAVMAGLCGIVMMHISYFSIINDSAINFLSVFRSNIRNLVFTVLVAPLFFCFLNKFLRIRNAD
ncbi:MAG: hypothetical protein ABH869_07595 [Candidatus Omnitrophota bacterium]